MDNGTREGLDKFLNAASSEPETVLHYEFMQDYKVWTEQCFLCVFDIFSAESYRELGIYLVGNAFSGLMYCTIRLL